MLQGRNAEADSPCGGSLTFGSTPGTDEVDRNSAEREGRYKKRKLGMTVGGNIWLDQRKG